MPLAAVAQTVGIATYAGQAGSAALTNATGTAARFSSPNQIASDGTNLFVADTANNAIRQIVISTGVVSTFASGLSAPTGVAVDAGGNVYVSDTGNNVIKRYNSGGTLTLTIGTGTAGSLNSTLLLSTFHSPQGIAVKSDGSFIYVADSGISSLNIRRIDVSNTIVTTLATMTKPWGLALNSAGTTLYVTDRDTGTVSSIANPQSSGTLVALTGTYTNPSAVTVDSAGDVYVTDTGNQTIKKISGVTVTTIAGSSGAIGVADGLGANARFNGPAGIVATGVNSLFIADTGSHTIRRATPTTAPAITSANNATFTLNSAGTFTVVASGSPAPTFSITTGSLPSGVTLNATTGVIAGTPTASGTFVVTVQASNGVGSAATQSFTLTVNQAPVFTSANSTTFTNNTPGTFTLTASGSPAPTFGYVSGTFPPFASLLNGVISGTPNGQATYVFVLSATNTSGTVTQTFTLTVGPASSAPVISAQPQSQTLSAGVTSTSFSVTATGTPAITSYQWERQAGGVGSFVTLSNGTIGTTTFSGATTATLSLTGVTPSLNADVYRVIIGNGTTPTTSSGAILTVQGTFPSITLSPSSATLDIGVTATFNGSASGNPTPTVRWQRQAANTIGFFDISEIFPYSGTTSGSLTVSGVTTGMNGDQFQLVATNVYGSATTAVATLAINSLVPLFTVSPQGTTVNIGQNASFTATAVGTPTPSLRWQRQPAGSFSGFFDLNDDGVYFGTTGNTLTIINSSVAMNGDQFRVVASNTNGTTPSSAATLTVSTTAPTITLNPSNVTANVGQSITFTGNATGVPAPTYRWQRQPSGTSGFVDLTDDGIYSGTTSVTLTVPVVSAGMTGDVFRLVASNAGGTTPSSVAILTVNLGTTITTFAGLANFAGATDGVGSAARFNTPTAIVSDASGNLVIADTGNSIIRRMTGAGVVTTAAGLSGFRGSVDGTGSEARFNSPGGVAVDSIGNIFVADTFSHTIRVISSAGVVTTLAGSPSASGGVDGVGNAARFFLPTGVALDTAGNLYVADTNNHAIRRISTGGTVVTFAGSLGTAGYVDSNNPLQARFNAPNAIAVDSSNNVYVADSQNNVIRKISVFGVVSTLAGNLNGFPGTADGAGTLASFNRPSGISVDSAGNVYVADSNSNTIRRVTSAGEVTTLAGLAGISGSADGAGNTARFSRPFGVVMDVNGNLWVSDTGNHTIRRSGTSTPPSITTQPASKAAGIGQNTTFTVVATGTPSPTSYQWQRQPAFTFGFVNLPPDTTYSGVNTATLTITNVTTAMQGDQFRVVVANGVSPAATSEAATLTVGIPAVFTSLPTATFKAAEPNSFTVVATSATTVTYTATGLPSWALLNSSTGVLSGIPPDNVGTPFTITLIANNGVPATQTFLLNVLPPNLPPTITTQPVAVVLDQGQTAAFSVTAGGTPPFTYQWRRNGIAIAGATSSTLSLTNIIGTSAGTYSAVVTNAAGTVTSAGASLVVNTIPTITSQPHAQVAVLGGSATFDVAVSGGASFTYQWRKNGVAIAGANAASLTVNNVTAADAGNFDVLVSNTIGSTTSSMAQLTTVTAATAPVITAQPSARSALAGTSATFSVAALGAPAPAYQWRKNGAPIAGANLSTLTLGSVQAGDAANYDVVVSNSAGNVTSSIAGLTILSRSYAGVYFGNFGGGLGTFALFVRDDNTGVFLGYLPASTAPVLSLGFTIGNTGQFTFNQGAILGGTASGDEPARAAALSPVTLSGTIANDGAVTGSIVGGANATISGTRSADTGVTQVAAGFYSAGAGTGSGTVYAIANANGQVFMVTQAGSASDGGVGSINAAGQVSVLTNRSIINATVNASAGLISGNSSGGVTGTFTGGSDAAVALQRLVNISSRARVGTADAVAIAGFVISGTESKPVLIRAVGPTLGAAPFNVTGALAAPRLELFRGATSIGTNAGIGTNRTAIDAAGQRAGAFALGTAGTDAAILTTLAPGNYTAVVSSATTATGVALVEVYDLSAAAAGQKLLNISTRASAGTAENTLIAGFVVPPGTSKRVVIRGVGPGLAPFGVTGVLAQPTLTLLSGSTTVATNTNWTTSPDAAAITAASAQVGAFGLSNNDSALIATLAPGNYTAQVTGPGTATGIALIEVYELP
ncbi:immunoglobulin domain-containing protein [Horticoccus sp. 23ND18S-11]|uniref:immunoglobulin domain-containing protein n=1 Tax=Horticoccus sp. 23ND18S-11 TaxID=3391832 RepID=UPI0039C9DB66